MTLGRYFRYEIQKKTILLSTIWIISYILVAIIDKSERIKRYLEIGEFIERAQKDKIIDCKVMALGGINEDNLPEIKDFGFGGAVVLGDVWNKFDACCDRDYLAVIEHFKKLKRLAD